MGTGWPQSLQVLKIDCASCKLGIIRAIIFCWRPRLLWRWRHKNRVIQPLLISRTFTINYLCGSDLEKTKEFNASMHLWCRWILKQPPSSASCRWVWSKYPNKFANATRANAAYSAAVAAKYSHSLCIGDQTWEKEGSCLNLKADWLLLWPGDSLWSFHFHLHSELTHAAWCS